MENISQMSLLEVALQIMDDKGGIVNIYDLINEVLALKGLDDADGKYAAQLYVDITTSSKFVYMGEDNWDLKSRQSLDQFDKDGASFNPKGEADTFDDEEEEDDEDTLSEDDIDEDEDDEDEDKESDDEDEDDEEDSETEDMYEPEDDLDEDSETDEDDDDSDNGIDEEKYNEYMDDYEDLYEA